MFKEGREDVGSDECCSCPITSEDANIEKGCEIIQQNHCLSICAIAEFVNIDIETVQKLYVTISTW